MKKGLVFLFAALLVVGLPLSALAGTQVYHFKDEPLISARPIPIDDTIPGPAAEFGQNVWVCYVGTRHSTVRVKTNKDDTTDVGWNSVITGDVTITPGQGGDYFVCSRNPPSPCCYFAEAFRGYSVPGQPAGGRGGSG